MRRFIIGILVPLSSLGASAHAGEPQLGDTRYDDSYSVGDWGASFLAGNAGGALGGFIGNELFAAAAGLYAEEGDFERVQVLGIAIGSTLGGAGGIYAYGELSGHSGNYWAAAGGWTVGLAGAVGVLLLAPGMSNDAATSGAIGLTALFTLPVLGGTLGYVLSLDSGGDGRIPMGGLIDLDGGEVRLGVPEIGVSLDAAGDLERVDVRLAGGRF